MTKIKRFKTWLEENIQLDKLVGFLKGKYGGNIKAIKQDSKFKKLSDGDKEVIIDRIK